MRWFLCWVGWPMGGSWVRLSGGGLYGGSVDGVSHHSPSLPLLSNLSIFIACMRTLLDRRSFPCSPRSSSFLCMLVDDRQQQRRRATMPGLWAGKENCQPGSVVDRAAPRRPAPPRPGLAWPSPACSQEARPGPVTGHHRPGQTGSHPASASSPLCVQSRGVWTIR